jgi:hypothetical protein
MWILDLSFFIHYKPATGAVTGWKFLRKSTTYLPPNEQYRYGDTVYTVHMYGTVHGSGGGLYTSPWMSRPTITVLDQLADRSVL